MIWQSLTFILLSLTAITCGVYRNAIDPAVAEQISVLSSGSWISHEDSQYPEELQDWAYSYQYASIQYMTMRNLVTWFSFDERRSLCQFLVVGDVYDTSRDGDAYPLTMTYPLVAVGTGFSPTEDGLSKYEFEPVDVFCRLDDRGELHFFADDETGIYCFGGSCPPHDVSYDVDASSENDKILFSILRKLTLHNNNDATRASTSRHRLSGTLYPAKNTTTTPVINCPFDRRYNNTLVQQNCYWSLK